MTGFDPGPAWEEVELSELGTAQLVLYSKDLVNAERCWVRKKPHLTRVRS